MSPEVRRALCPTEKWFWIADQVSPTNSVARVHLRGHIAAGLLERAAAALAAEHPLLRVSITIRQPRNKPGVRAVGGADPDPAGATATTSNGNVKSKSTNWVRRWIGSAVR